MTRLEQLQKKKRQEVEKLLSKIAKGMMLFEDGDVTDGSAGVDWIKRYLKKQKELQKIELQISKEAKTVHRS